MAPGEALLLYTDGVSEARDVAGNEYGAARLTDIAGAGGTHTAQTLTNACVEDVKRFYAGAPKADDLTVMAVRHTEPARS